MGQIVFDNHYARLPERFYSPQEPVPVAEPGVRAPEPCHWQKISVSILSGSLARPEPPCSLVITCRRERSRLPPPTPVISSAGSTRNWATGRAVLLGEIAGPQRQTLRPAAERFGANALFAGAGTVVHPSGPVLREYILCEAMHRLDVPTTRALAAVTTGERVVREDVLPGAVLARVASSHIRIGTFQYFAARKDTEALHLLTDHVIARHYPELDGRENRTAALLGAVAARQAQLIAKWQTLGFIHGVMNTDNVLISGETIDYGPCAFMDEFNPEQVYSSIDHGGRYAYRNQPGIAHWNLSCLANSLIPILHDDQEQAIALAQSALDGFPDLFLEANAQGTARKLGAAHYRRGRCAAGGRSLAPHGRTTA